MAVRHRTAPGWITWPHASESGNSADAALRRLCALDASRSEEQTRLCAGSLAGGDLRFTRHHDGRDHTHWLFHRSQPWRRPDPVWSTTHHQSHCPNTGFALLLIGVALWLLNSQRGSRRALEQLVALFPIGVALISLLGYAYSA